MMNETNFRPCELILKVGCNESEEISTALTTLLRSCSINDEKIFLLERQIQPTSYFNSFTNQLSTLKTSFPCQSISCVIFLTDELVCQQQKKDFFKSNSLWNFHHKIELINEYKDILARQDYYELSYFLPLWSISHIPYNKQIIIRFNIFTKNFDLMIRFYENLFQRKPDSSKIGFVLYHLPTKSNIVYQFSIKYAPSIQSYSISQSSHLKFYLNNLNNFLHQYTSKLFRINPSEYYIYDPDSNLLHLHIQNFSSTIRETFIQTNDSGFGDSSSDPSIQLFHPTINSIKHYLNKQIPFSNDSGQCSSISSNEIPKNSNRSLPKSNGISVRTAKKSEIDYRLKQQQQQQSQFSIYESEPRLSNFTNVNNRYYSSMNNIQITHPLSIHRFKSSVLKKFDDQEREISYEVDSPRTSESLGYLNAFLLKKQTSLGPKSALVFNQPLSFTTKPKSDIPKPISNQSLKFRSKSATFDRQSTSTDDEQMNDRLNPTETSRINIGITLDSRLRKTPVLDMLRSTTMQIDTPETPRFNRTFSLRHSSTPIARF